MANKVVDATQLDADLLSVAEAIREKGGTSAALHFPEEFITAINDIHGGGDAYAAISVTYPAGSVCTCSQMGQDTLTAGDTSGTWLFVVPVGGEWTVTATQGDSTSSQMVSISEYGQIEHVTLLYRLWLYRDGDQCSDITGGWTSIDYTFAGISPGTARSNDMYFASTNFLGTEKKVKRKAYTEIVVNLTGATGSSSYRNLLLSHAKNEPASPSNTIAIFHPNLGENRYPLPDSLPEEFLVVFYTYTSTTMVVDKVWME